MGQELPQISNAIPDINRKDLFQSKYIQRIKETPFIDAEIYNTAPLIFTDPLGPHLAQLIKPRLGTKQLFPEQQIQKLIISVLNGLKDLEENGFEGHGDISLETLFYSKKQKYFKLTHPAFNKQSGYLLTKHGKRFTTLSPQQLSALSDDSQDSQVSFKSDLFAFGIVLCQVCTLTASSDIYCPDTYSIFHLEIQKRLKTIEQYYSNTIVEIVKSCLLYDPDQRPDTAQLLFKFNESKRAKSSVKQHQ